jgi:hypothetical protein
MKRIVHKARNHRAAAKWDILQQVRMTPNERQAIAKELKKRFFGRTVPDVRDTRN